MLKINEFLEKNTGLIAIAIAVIGFIGHTLLLVLNYSKWIWTFVMIYIQDPLSLIMRRFPTGQRISYFSFLFLIMLTVGGFHYIKSNGKDARLIKFGLSIIAVRTFLTIILTPFFFLQLKQQAENSLYSDAPSVSAIDIFLPLIFLIPLAYICFYLTKFLVNREVLDYKSEGLADGQMKFSFDIIPLKIRFAHYLFDFFLVGTLIFPIVLQQFMVFAKNTAFFNHNYETIILSILIAVSTIIYFLIFEGIFKATPIKFLTGTRVVSIKDMSNPGFLTILGRSLCRRIPFEPFSYFDENGRWHDRISATDVIFLKREGWLKFKQYFWIFLLLVSYLITFGGSFIMESIYDAKSNKLIARAKDYQKESVFKNLNAGDILIFKPKNANYKADQTVLFVENVSDDEVSGTRYKVMYDNRIKRTKYLQLGITADWVMEGDISIKKSELSNAYFSGHQSQAVQIQNTTYKLIDIFDLDNPLITSSSSSGSGGPDGINRIHRIKYDASQITILSLDVIEGSADWEINLPFVTPFEKDRATGSFELRNNRESKKASKTRMKVRYDGNEHNYIIFKFDSSIYFSKEHEE